MRIANAVQVGPRQHKSVRWLELNLLAAVRLRNGKFRAHFLPGRVKVLRGECGCDFVRSTAVLQNGQKFGVAVRLQLGSSQLVDAFLIVVANFG